MHATPAAAATSILTAVAGTAAGAHDQWADGGTVPARVRAQCCGPSDAHHLAPSQVHVTPAGYQVDGYRAIIPESRLLPSPDGDWWVFYRDNANDNQGPVYRFFGPPQGS